MIFFTIDGPASAEEWIETVSLLQSGWCRNSWLPFCLSDTNPARWSARMISARLREGGGAALTDLYPNGGTGDRFVEGRSLPEPQKAFKMDFRRAARRASALGKRGIPDRNLRKCGKVGRVSPVARGGVDHAV